MEYSIVPEDSNAYMTAFDLVIDFVEKGHRKFVKTHDARQLKALAECHPVEVQTAIRNAFEEYFIFEENLYDSLADDEARLLRYLFPGH